MFQITTSAFSPTKYLKSKTVKVGICVFPLVMMGHKLNSDTFVGDFGLVRSSYVLELRAFSFSVLSGFVLQRYGLQVIFLIMFLYKSRLECGLN